MKLKIRKGANVQVIAGADKGKKGSVLEVDPKGLRLKVQGVKVMTHFDKKDGLKKLEGFIPYSKVKLLDQAPVVAKAKKAAAKNFCNNCCHSFCFSSLTTENFLAAIGFDYFGRVYYLLELFQQQIRAG